MQINKLPDLSLGQAIELVKDGIEANVPTGILSDPGIGKTALMANVASAYGLAFTPLEFGLCSEEDSGGIPIRTKDADGNDVVIRIPLGPILQACKAPSLFLLDEITRANRSKQGALMTGINERRFGDFKLHPGTRIVLCGNVPGRSGGVHTLIDALLSRASWTLARVDRALWGRYVRGDDLPEGTPDPVSPTLRALLTDYSLTAEVRPDLLPEHAPEGFAETGELYANPRTVYFAMARLAARIDSGRLSASADGSDPVTFANLSGTIGQTAAAFFLTTRRLRHKLASPEQIKADPYNCTVPTDGESSIAALGLIGTVNKDPAAQATGAAWVYASRIPAPECRAAVARVLLPTMIKIKEKKAIDIANRLLAETSKRLK